MIPKKLRWLVSTKSKKFKNYWLCHPTGNESDNFVLVFKVYNGIHKEKDATIAQLMGAGNHNIYARILKEKIHKVLSCNIQNEKQSADDELKERVSRILNET